MPKHPREQTATLAVKVWLVQNAMTQDGLAKELGISSAYLSRILAGYRPAPADIVSHLKRKTGIDLSQYDGIEVGA